MMNKRILLFDLGGVIINIDYKATIDAFERLGIPNFKEMFSQANQSGLFDDYETGRISSFHFINKVLDYLPKGTTANQVVHAWNAMILDWPKSRLEYLQRKAKTHDLYIFSNTNELHIEKARRTLLESTNLPMEAFVTKVFLSHEVGVRKPHASSFQKILDLINAQPEEVLFVDDSIQHVEGAKSIGIEAIHLTGEITDHPSFS